MGWDPDTLAREVEQRATERGTRSSGVVVGAFAPGAEGSTVRAGGDAGLAPDALFEIGSVTKAVTATLLAEAVGRDEVALDTPLVELAPRGSRVPSHDGVPITLEHLATHTAGLPRLPAVSLREHLGWLRRGTRDPYAHLTREVLFEVLGRVRLRHPPGSRRARYSNFGYGLLGQALELATDRDLDALVAERITGPLGMVDTTFGPTEDQRARSASGHSRRGRPRPPWHLGALAGAGGLWGTVPDLLELLRAQLHPPGALADAIALTQQPRARLGRGASIGLAWVLMPGRRGEERILQWHNGGTGGFRSIVVVTDDPPVGVAVCVDDTRSPDRLAFDLHRTLVEGVVQ